jgi:glycosyltransferase involved in cell wall biosynthesis
VTALHDRGGIRPGLIFRLARLLREWQVDLLHAHDDRACLYGSLAARWARVPRIVHTRHGRSAGSSPRQVRLMRWATRLAEQVICVSEDAARLAQQNGVAATKVCTIWNGIDLKRFGYCGPNPSGPVVTVARLSPEKGIDSLIRAAALVVRELPSFRLVLAGDGPCRVALEELTTNLGLEAHVCFRGDVRNIPELLGGAGLFVLPSLSEGISLTLLEAMARGLPVVTTLVGGNPEVVEEGATGLLVPPADPGALARAILLLLQDSDRSQRMGQLGRRRVEAQFDVQHMVAAYEAAYQRLAHQPRAQARGAFTPAATGGEP